MASSMATHLRAAETTRRNLLVSRISIGLGCVTGAYFVIALILGPPQAGIMWIEALSTLFFALLGWAAANDRVRYAPELLVASTLLHAVVASINADGVIGIGPTILFVVFVVAGMVLRPRVNIVFGALSIGAVLLIAWLTAQGYVIFSPLAIVTPTPLVIVGYTVVYTLLLCFVAVMAFMSAQSHDHALAQIAAQADAMHERNEQLVAQQALLEAQAAELEHHATRLEQDVAVRTQELQTALDDVQRAVIMLRDMQNPLVPIAEGTLVVPLVGAVDSARATQFVQDLLQGIEQRRAHTVLLDVTGLPIVDTLAAHTLLQTAQAAKLLGATVVLVGVSPEIAQTIVGLGIDLRSIQIERDLQSAVAHVLAAPRSRQARTTRRQKMPLRAPSIN